MPFTLIKQEKPANECVFLGGDRWEANMLYITWPSPSKAPWDTSSSSLTEADRSNLNRIWCVHTKGSSRFFFFFAPCQLFFQMRLMRWLRYPGKHSPYIRSTAGARESWELICSFPGWADCSLDSVTQTESGSTAGSTAGRHGHGSLLEKRQ